MLSCVYCYTHTSIITIGFTIPVLIVYKTMGLDVSLIGWSTLSDSGDGSKEKICANPECCNLFKNHGRRAKGVRLISKQLSEWDPSPGLQAGNKLCVLCRKCVMAGLTTNSLSETREVADPSTVGVVEALEDNISTLNTSMSPLGIFPFKKLRLRQSKQYSKVKAKRVGTAIKQRLQAMNVEISDTSSDQLGESEILQQLKDAFHASMQKCLKAQILTIVPNSWTRHIKAH